MIDVILTDEQAAKVAGGSGMIRLLARDGRVLACVRANSGFDDKADDILASLKRPDQEWFSPTEVRAHLARLVSQRTTAATSG